MNRITLLCEKSKAVSFVSLIVKTVVVFGIGSRARFPVKLICCIAFSSPSGAC